MDRVTKISAGSGVSEFDIFISPKQPLSMKASSLKTSIRITQLHQKRLHRWNESHVHTIPEESPRTSLNLFLFLSVFSLLYFSLDFVKCDSTTLENVMW
mmetsp:Transcript_1747/g.6157  ORF Transcript_1747/g.6157 Transcript_1747/m.6157 type:complete len:99 (-) Transcript_1747:3285-3581(-)